MPEDNLRLNSLDRFSKHSTHLHLEEHGHCEVPAGCGGVVLRWYDPRAGVPVLFRAYIPGPSRIFLDGDALASSRPLVAPGRHVLAIELDASLPGQGLVMFSATYDPTPGDKAGSARLLLSLPGGAWVFNKSPAPDEAWRVCDDDPSGWGPMVQSPMDTPDRKAEWGRWNRFDALTRLGAQPLGMPVGPAIARQGARFGALGRWLAPLRLHLPEPRAAAVRIRTTFEVTAPLPS